MSKLTGQGQRIHKHRMPCSGTATASPCLAPDGTFSQMRKWLLACINQDGLLKHDSIFSLDPMGWEFGSGPP